MMVMFRDRDLVDANRFHAIIRNYRDTCTHCITHKNIHIQRLGIRARFAYAPKYDDDDVVVAFVVWPAQQEQRDRAAARYTMIAATSTAA